MNRFYYLKKQPRFYYLKKRLEFKIISIEGANSLENTISRMFMVTPDHKAYNIAFTVLASKVRIDADIVVAIPLKVEYKVMKGVIYLSNPKLILRPVTDLSLYVDYQYKSDEFISLLGRSNENT